MCANGLLDHYSISVPDSHRGRKTAKIGGITMKNFEVFENNAGGLALVVYGPHYTVEYIHTG